MGICVCDIEESGVSGTALTFCTSVYKEMMCDLDSACCSIKKKIGAIYNTLRLNISIILTNINIIRLKDMKSHNYLL